MKLKFCFLSYGKRKHGIEVFFSPRGIVGKEWIFFGFVYRKAFQRNIGPYLTTPKYDISLVKLYKYYWSKYVAKDW